MVTFRKYCTLIFTNTVSYTTIMYLVCVIPILASITVHLTTARKIIVLKLATFSFYFLPVNRVLLVDITIT